MKIYLLKRKYSTGLSPGLGNLKVPVFKTSVFMSERKEDLTYNFSPFVRVMIDRERIPELWDKLVEGEVTEFNLFKNISWPILKKKKN